MPGEAAGDVARDERFAFARNRARDQNRFGKIELGVNLDRAVDAEKGLGPGGLAVGEQKIPATSFEEQSPTVPRATKAWVCEIEGSTSMSVRFGVKGSCTKRRTSTFVS